MKLISHRGNIRGPKPDKENRPSYIDCAIQLGYDVEVDIRYINGEFWLGHDEPQYKVEVSWIKLRKDKIWFHCKDHNSSVKFLELCDNYKFFCHNNDDYVLTSNGYLWVHDLGSNINEKCIIPLLSDNDISSYKGNNPGFICTDYVYKINF
jgi:hypothetical protein